MTRPGFTDLARGFIMGDLSPEDQRIVTAFWGRIIARTLFAVFACWALGWLSWAGMSNGFARADEVNDKISKAVTPIAKRLDGVEQSLEQLKEEQRRARIEQLERSLFDLRKSQCVAIANENREAVQFYQLRIDSLQRDYRTLIGSRHNIPTCAEVGA